MSNYLITGITGFVGPHLANLLIDNGHKVYGLVRGSNGNETDILDVVKPDKFKEIEFVYGDLLCKSSIDSIISSYRFDGIFHLAAQSHPPTSFEAPLHTFKTNTVGSITLIDLILRKQPDCRLMNCSTSEVYGSVEEICGAINEDFPIAPVNPYAVSKASVDMYVTERARSVGANIFNTRAFSHTGPRRGYKFSISSDAFQIAKIVSNKQKYNIRVGTLSSRRAVIDVRDCVKAYYLLMGYAAPGESYNIGGNTVYSMGELLERMLRAHKLYGEVELVVDSKLVRPIDIPLQIPDCTKVKELTNWGPEISIDTTLYDLVGYWRRKMRTHG